MASHFCSTSGTLLYGVDSDFLGQSILQIGTVTDFHLHETQLKSQVEQFIESCGEWLDGVEGVPQVEGLFTG